MYLRTRQFYTTGRAYSLRIQFEADRKQLAASHQVSLSRLTCRDDSEWPVNSMTLSSQDLHACPPSIVRCSMEVVGSISNPPTVDIKISCYSVYPSMAELSKAMASFFCACSRDSPELKPSHGAHRQATLVADGSFGYRPQHTSRSAWADSVR